METSKIKTARDSRGWSQAELADRVGVRSNTIARIERGEQTPRVPLAIKLATEFGTSVEEMFGDAVDTSDAADEGADTAAEGT